MFIIKRFSMKFPATRSALPLMIAVMLSACGGESASTLSAANVMQSGEPPPVLLATTAFVSRARLEHCSEVRNRLFVLDNRMVLWDRVGNCPDNSFAQVLFGANVDTILCSAKETIAGPVVSCTDPANRALFDTIRNNLPRTDLGLGAGHSVTEVNFLPRDGSAVPFEALFNTAFSGIGTPRQVVVRDAAAFAELWKQHGANTSPAPASPTIDFYRHMVIGLFAGTSQSCHEIGLRRLTVSGDKLVAQYTNRVIISVAPCHTALTAPMQLTIVKRSDAAVQFERVAQ